MGYLNNLSVYLSGPIQYSEKENWRDLPKKLLPEEFGINLFDPFSDPKQQWVPKLKEAQKNKDYKTLRSIAKDFVRKDLHTVDLSHFVIAYLPHKVPTVGTVHEIINSNDRKKPTLLVTDMEDISYIPLWYFGFIKTEFMFAGWDALFNYLREVDQGLHKTNDRWRFACNQI